MLQKFLVIGVGGSGGKTLQLLRFELLERLRERGWAEGVPRGWQFLHIDVPEDPDTHDPDLPPVLGAESYVGIATDMMANYSTYDSKLLQSATKEVIEALGGWRPDPEEVHITVDEGAGQFRAIGRGLTLAGRAAVSAAIDRAIGRLLEHEADEELDRASLQLQSTTNTRLDPAVIVVSSLAGGTGSGAFLDVCNLLRSKRRERPWLEKLVALLQAPDLFDDLPVADRQGVNPNALAAVSELIASLEGSGDDAAAVADAALLLGPKPSLGSRGPLRSLIIGRRNKAGEFSQFQVYRSTARTLSTWMTDDQIQRDLSSYTLGSNWDQACQTPESLGILGERSRFSSFGFASLGLGRNRFGTYAAERLARSSVDRLQRVHLDTEEFRQRRVTSEQALQFVVDQRYDGFRSQCGLNELGDDHNQVLDALRDSDFCRSRLEAAKAKILEGLGTQDRSPSDWASIVAASVDEEERLNILPELRGHVVERARSWASNDADTSGAIVPRLLETVARSLAENGAPATLLILRRLTDEIEQQVCPELLGTGELQKWERRRSTAIASIRSKLIEFTQPLMQRGNKLIGEAVSSGLGSSMANLEAELRRLAADLLADLARNVLRPLTKAVADAVDSLTLDETGQDPLPSKVAPWASVAVPQRLSPAPNEILLESIETYPERFDREVAATAGGSPEDAARRAVGQVITGAWDRGLGSTSAQQLIVSGASWRPERAEARISAGAVGGDAPQAASFRVQLGADDLLSRSRDWVTQRNRAIGDFVAEGLGEYLGGGAGTASTARRLAAFKSSFGVMLDRSDPLVLINQTVCSEVHGGIEEPERKLSVIPFPTGHAARQTAEEVLHQRKIDPKKVRWGESDGATTSRIEVVSFLSAPLSPVVFQSILGPIAAEWTAKQQTDEMRAKFWRWRRARPLQAFVPLPAERLQAMVRGWFTGRALGRIDNLSPGLSPRIVTTAGALRFPEPLLGDTPWEQPWVLPAVLESLPLAIVEYSQGHPEGLDAYKELLRLGTEAQYQESDRYGRYARLNDELAEWIRSGAPRQGLPVPPEDRAGSSSGTPESRLEALMAWLNDQRAYFAAEGAKQFTAEMALEDQRPWEIYGQVTEAISALVTATERCLESPTSTRVG